MAGRGRVTIKGIASTMRLMRRTAKRVERFELDVMDKYSDKLVDLARKYAPRDLGDLEASIDKWPDKEGPRHRRIWWVGVNDSLLGPSYTTYGHRYDIYQHERAHKPGKNTHIKGSQLGLPVGGTSARRIGSKYLERAAKQIEKEMNKIVEERLVRELRAAGW